jgi:hypothetical protein
VTAEEKRLFNCNHVRVRPSGAYEIRTSKDKIHWKFKCPLCHETHMHGSVAGHRVSHCQLEPFKSAGYYLV